MNTSFRQLRLFLALAEKGSVSAAAQACHVTQPTASMQLRELADAVGLPLHEVIGRKVFLTPAGEELARTARAMADEWEAFEQRMAAMKGLTRGRLRVAVVSTAKYFVPRLLGGFCASHPEIDISLEVLNRDGVLARLRENLDDLSIMSIPPGDLDIECHEFLDNPLVLVAPARHPLVSEKGLQLGDLASERFILREAGSGTRQAGDAHFRACGFQPRVRLELGSNEAIKQAVAGGMGLSLLSRHALGQADESLLAELDVAGFPLPAHWYIVYPRGKRLSPIASVFLQHLKAAADQPSEPVPPRK
ncbi:LysR family transcriptional regulator [Uliginosibacterium paludis]|uniref:LysR family transcriptional regulator n=1 Tax=Uliginosibacterium paludis TaxID=1615952 RepID=A0ABV2CS79_9RHOO